MAHYLGELTESNMKNLQALIDSNSVIGREIVTPDGTVILPVSKVSFGFGSGGGTASGCVAAAHLFALRKCVFFHKNPFQIRRILPETAAFNNKKGSCPTAEVTNTNNTACAVFFFALSIARRYSHYQPCFRLKPAAGPLRACTAVHRPIYSLTVSL